VDFEYAAPNPAAFDIANHFHEWTANYHGDHPERLDPSMYPNPAERRNFYTGYLAAQNSDGAVVQADLDVLDAQVGAWSPASHAMCAIWGLVQAREQLEGATSEGEFDYVAYSRCRFRLFQDEIAHLGVGN
jgi:choline kinase